MFIVAPAVTRPENHAPPWMSFANYIIIHVISHDKPELNWNVWSEDTITQLRARFYSNVHASELGRDIFTFSLD